MISQEIINAHVCDVYMSESRSCDGVANHCLHSPAIVSGLLKGVNVQANAVSLFSYV